MVFLTAFLFSTSSSAIPPGSLHTPNTELADKITVGSYITYLGKVFGYETGYGRVDVKSDGYINSFGLRLTHNTELNYDNLNFGVDSYFAGSQAGANTIESHLISLKTIFPVNEPLIPHHWRYGIEYKLLTESSFDDIHFINLFTGTNLGTVYANGGVSTYFGESVDTEFGVFANLIYKAGNDVEIFAEYSTLDFTRAYINNYIAAGARNIGVINTGNAPKDAFSYGVRLKREKYFTLDFTLYDLDLTTSPFLGVSLNF